MLYSLTTTAGSTWWGRGTSSQVNSITTCSGRRTPRRSCCSLYRCLSLELRLGLRLWLHLRRCLRRRSRCSCCVSCACSTRGRRLLHGAALCPAELANVRRNALGVVRILPADELDSLIPTPRRLHSRAVAWRVVPVVLRLCKNRLFVRSPCSSQPIVSVSAAQHSSGRCILLYTSQGPTKPPFAIATLQHRGSFGIAGPGSYIVEFSAASTASNLWTTSGYSAESSRC